MKVCPKCKSKNPDDAMFCSKCGFNPGGKQDKPVTKKKNEELKKVKIVKWSIVAILGLSVIFFFFPYFFIAGENYNPMKLMGDINANQSYIRSDAMFEVIFGFVVPLILTVLSAFILAFKTSIPKTVICVILNVLAVGIYFLGFNVSFLITNSENIGFGLIGNVVITCLGVILPIVNVVFYKRAVEH